MPVIRRPMVNNIIATPLSPINLYPSSRPFILGETPHSLCDHLPGSIHLFCPILAYTYDSPGLITLGRHVLIVCLLIAS